MIFRSMAPFRRLFLLGLLIAIGCRSQKPHEPDRPRLVPGVRMIDISIPSDILHREMTARVIAPIEPPDNAPVVYLLHGAGADYRDWAANSSIADLAAHGVLLIMPDGGESYYVNDARGFRYEDYFVQEFLPVTRQLFPYVTRDRSRTAIVGISRGGFAAAVFALKHPELFSYVGGLSSAYDLADRRFRWRAPLESMSYRKVFGPPGSAIRTSNDPNLLVANTMPSAAPYFYLSCGDKDVLLPTSQHFSALLQEHGIPHEFHQVRGDHNWGVWGPQIPALEASLLTHFGISPEKSSPR